METSIARAPTPATSYLVSNGEIAAANFGLIEQARQEVICIEFLVRDDEFGLMKMALLREKARQGKRVILHVDSFHLLVDFALVRHLMDEGIEFTIFNELSLSRFSRFSIRNHSKALVVDGRLLRTGDSNTGNEYVKWPSRLQMKSMDIIVKGEVAQQARRYALDLIASPLAKIPDVQLSTPGKVASQRKLIRGLTKTAKTLFRALHIRMDAPDQITRPSRILVTPQEVRLARQKLDAAQRRYKQMKKKSPRTLARDWLCRGTQVESIRFFCDPIEGRKSTNGVIHSILSFIRQTKEHLIIVSPYLILTPEVRQALKQALEAKVHVQIYTNSLQSTDNETTQMAYEYRFAEMVQIGNLEIYEYQGPETLHAKFMVSDESSCMIMTYNLDWRSEVMNLETAIQMKSSSLARDLGLWIERHHGSFNLVAQNRVALKEPLVISGFSNWTKRLLIQFIEHHL